MITTADLAGYTASTMVLFTFMTKDMRLLRVLAIFSNVAFITYGMLVWLPPVLCLHLLLLRHKQAKAHLMNTIVSLVAPSRRQAI